jgi:hypothetical protein
MPGQRCHEAGLAPTPKRRRRDRCLSSEDEQEGEEEEELAPPSPGEPEDLPEDLLEVLTAADAVAAARWICSICCATFGGEETAWVLDCCRGKNQFCATCLRRCLQLKLECPYHAAPVPQLVVCGVSVSSENYVKEVQSQRVRVEGLLRCGDDGCHGLLKQRDPGVKQCDVCQALFCSNTACGRPYALGHSCEKTFAEAARQLDPPVRCCPGCGQASDKVEGCNVVRHTACRTNWCFLCGERVTTWGCTHSTCKAADSAL